MADIGGQAVLQFTGSASGLLAEAATVKRHLQQLQQQGTFETVATVRSAKVDPAAAEAFKAAQQAQTADAQRLNDALREQQRAQDQLKSTPIGALADAFRRLRESGDLQPLAASLSLLPGPLGAIAGKLSGVLALVSLFKKASGAGVEGIAAQAQASAAELARQKAALAQAAVTAGAWAVPSPQDIAALKMAQTAAWGLKNALVQANKAAATLGQSLGGAHAPGLPLLQAPAVAAPTIPAVQGVADVRRQLQTVQPAIAQVQQALNGLGGQTGVGAVGRSLAAAQQQLAGTSAATSALGQALSAVGATRGPVQAAQGAAQLATNLASAGSAAGGIGGTLSGVLSSVSGVAAALGPVGIAVAAALAGVYLLKQAWDLISDAIETGTRNIQEQSRLARRFDLTQGQAGGLQFAAALRGRSAEDATTALEHLQRRLGEARNGSQEAQRALERLGISQADLFRVDTGEALNRAANAYGAMSSAAQQSAAAHAVFGRELEGVIPLLRQGSAGLAAAQAAAESWGAAVSAADAATVRAAVQAQQAASATTGAAFGGITNQLAVAVAPVRQLFSEAFTGIVEFLKPVFDFVRGGVASVGRWLGQFTGGIRDAFQAAEPVLTFIQGQLADAFRSLQEAFGGAGTGLRDFGRLLGGQLAVLLGVLAAQLSLVVRVVAGVAGAFRFMWDAARPVMQLMYASVMRLVDALTAANRLLHGDFAAAWEATQHAALGRPAQEAVAAAGPAAPAAAGAVELRNRIADAADAVRRQMEDAAEMSAALREAFGDSGGTAEQIRAFQEAFRQQQELQHVGATQEDLLPLQAAQWAAGVTTANSAAEEWLTTLQGTGGAFAASAEWARVYQLAQQGASAATLQAVEAALVQQERMQALQQDMQAGAQLIQQFLTPLEAFRDRVGNLDRMLQEGAIDQDTYALAVEQAVNSLDEADRRARMASVAALTEGSREAMSAVARSMRFRDEGRERPVDRVREALDNALVVQRRQLDEAREMVRELRRGGVLRPAGI